MPIAPGSAVAIYTKPNHPEAARLAHELAAWLESRSYEAWLPDGVESPLEGSPALAVVLGGDGTMLYVARRLAGSPTPVFAVHLGTLGFLTDTPREQLYPSLEAILATGGVQQHRSLLHVDLLRDGENVSGFEAVNEAVVGKGALARMIRVELRVDRALVGTYRADGLLVATPTGSTAYSFSAGGPVLDPSLAALVITPICPHALNQRPLVVPNHSEITVQLERGAEPTYLTLDGQQGVPLHPGDAIRCTRSQLGLTLVSAGERSFFRDLRTKLHWG